MLHKKISTINVVSLLRDSVRREHVQQHFADLGIDTFTFFDAVSHEDQAVIDAYNDGMVKRFPPCFRCGKRKCECKNNILIPQQVANWLSFLAL